MSKKTLLTEPFMMVIGALRAIRTIGQLKAQIRDLRKELKQTNAKANEYEHALRILAGRESFLDGRFDPQALARITLDSPPEETYHE